MIPVLWKDAQPLCQNPLQGTASTAGLAEPFRKGRLDTWDFSVHIFKGPFLSLHPPALEQTLNLSGSERSTVRSKTQHSNHKEGSSVLSSSLSVLTGPGGPTQAKTLPGANWHLEPWTEASMERVMQRKGLCSHLPVGDRGRGREASQLGCLSRSLGLFKSQTHLNHICRFQNDSRILAAQKPLWCLEGVNLKK